MNLHALKGYEERLNKKNRGAESNKELDAQIAELKRRIRLRESVLGKELDDQYSLAVLKMMFNEVLFRFRCRVEEEKKWWFFNRTNVKSLLTAYERDIPTDVAGLENRLSESIEDLVALKKTSEDQSVVYQKVSDFVSRISIDLGFKGFKASKRPYAIQDSTLEARFKVLDAILIQKEDELERQLNKEDAFGFDKIPNYQTMSETDKSKHEDLFLKAIAPAFPSCLSTVSLENVLVSSSSDQVQNRNDAKLLNKVLKTISHIYSDSKSVSISVGQRPDKETVLEQVRSRNFWGTWSTEYKRVSKLLAAAEKPVLDDDTAAETLARIDRLARRKMTESNATKFQDMKDAFEAKRSQRVEKEMSEAFPYRSTQDKFESYENDLKIAYAFPDTKTTTPVIELIREEKKLPGQAYAPLAAMVVDSLPDNVADLQAMAYFIFLNHSVKGASTASLPCTWTQQSGLVISAPHADLLNKLTGLLPGDGDEAKQSRALYLTALIISIALTITTQETNEYELLRNLLIDVLDKKYDPRNIDSKMFDNTDFKYLLSYLPNNTLTLSRTNTAQSKNQLLEKFPKPEEITSRSSLIGLAESFRESFFNISPQRASDSFKSDGADVDTQNLDRVTLRKQVQTRAAYIAGTENGAIVSFSSVVDVLNKNIELYPAAHYEVLGVLTLLQWYKTFLKKGVKILKQQDQDFVDYYDGLEKQLISIASSVSLSNEGLSEMLLGKMPKNKSNSLGRLFSGIRTFVSNVRTSSPSRNFSISMTPARNHDSALPSMTPPGSSVSTNYYSMLRGGDNNESQIDESNSNSILSPEEFNKACDAAEVTCVERTQSTPMIPILPDISEQSADISFESTGSSSSIFGSSTSLMNSPSRWSSWFKIAEQEDEAGAASKKVMTEKTLSTANDFVEYIAGSPLTIPVAEKLSASYENSKKHFPRALDFLHILRSVLKWYSDEYLGNDSSSEEFQKRFNSQRQKLLDYLSNDRDSFTMDFPEDGAPDADVYARLLTVIQSLLQRKSMIVVVPESSQVSVANSSP